MAEHLIIKVTTKEERYATLIPQIQALVEAESDMIANMANIAACIMETFHFWWVGFYRVVNDGANVRWHAQESEKDAECVAQHGKSPQQSSSMM